MLGLILTVFPEVGSPQDSVGPSHHSASRVTMMELVGTEQPADPTAPMAGESFMSRVKIKCKSLKAGVSLGWFLDQREGRSGWRGPSQEKRHRGAPGWEQRAGLVATTPGGSPGSPRASLRSPIPAAQSQVQG